MNHIAAREESLGVPFFRSLRVELLLLAFVSLVPFLLYTGNTIRESFEQARQATLQKSLMQAKLIAARLDDHVGNIDSLMLALAGTLADVPLDTIGARQLKTIRAGLPAYYSNIGIFSADGELLASSYEALPAQARFNISDRKYFKEAVAGRLLAVGEPVISRVSGIWSLSLARPVIDHDGKVRGVISISTRLERFQELLTPEALPPGSVMTLLNESGTVLARTLDPAQWIGRQIMSDALRRAYAEGEIVQEVSSSADGVARLSAYVKSNKLPWVMYVGIPTEVALAQARTEAWLRAAVTLLTLALAITLAWALSRRIARPVQALSQDAKRLGAGELSHRTQVRSSNELGLLAASFNRMADALETGTRQVRDSQSAAQKQLLFIQTLIDTIPNPVFYKDRDGRYLGGNKAFEDYIGISEQDIVGKTVFDIAPADLAERYKKADDDLLQSGGLQVYEAEVRYADGTRHDVIFNKAVFSNPQGEVEGLLGVILDITERKRAEQALRQSEERYRDLAESSPVGIWHIDTEGHTLYMNRSMAGMLDTDDPAQLVGKPWLPFFSPESVDTIKFEQAKRQDGVTSSYEVSIIGLRGTQHHALVSGAPLFNADGRLRGMVGTFIDITERKEADERIRHMAHHDTLTGLPNRATLEDRIGQAIVAAQRNGTQTAVLFLDLDRFKTINDSLGHQVGDELLKAVGRHLPGCLREGDTVARLGGDEFVISLPSVKDTRDVALVAAKVLEDLAQPFFIAGQELHIGGSIGISLYPDDGEDAATLMKNADIAMYHAKEQGRNNYQYFTPTMNAQAQQRLALDNDLRRALKRDEFELYYQPLIDLVPGGPGGICGAEALLRWRHPERGLIHPADFIPVAEDTGLIVPLGEWVVEQALRQLHIWHAAGHAGLRLAINLSARQFRHAELTETIARALRDNDIDPACVELEITEGVIMQRGDETSRNLNRLSQMGLQLSIDDFGVGYSSLSYLKRFPIHTLKIDRSFVRDITIDPSDAAIVTAIIVMAHSLGLQVVGEGVETAEQLKFLKSLGCDLAQGNYFSRPLPVSGFAELLQTGYAVSAAA